MSVKQAQCAYLLGDGAIDVRDDDLVVPVPQVDGALAATRSLVLSGYAEGDVIRSISQPQTRLGRTTAIHTNIS